jgi:hypothetical protein
LHQGDGSTYTGLHLSASLLGGTGSCGDGSYAPGTYTSSQYVHITVTGGVAPYTVTVINWVDSFGSMLNERFDPYGGTFTGTGVGGDPLNNPTWTYSGATDGENIIFSGNGLCRVDNVDAGGTATVHVIDSVGTIVTHSIDWEYERNMDSM